MVLLYAGSAAAMWLCSSQWTAAMGFQVGRLFRVLASKGSHAKGCGLCFLYVNLCIKSQQADLNGSTINQT